MTDDEADAAALSLLVIYGRPARYWYYDRDPKNPWGVQVRTLARRNAEHSFDRLGEFSLTLKSVMYKMHPDLRAYSAGRTAVIRALQRQNVLWLRAMRDDPDANPEEAARGESAA